MNRAQLIKRESYENVEWNKPWNHFINLFDFGIILNVFSSATIWAIQIQVSFPGVKNPKNPGIQPRYK